MSKLLLSIFLTIGFFAVFSQSTPVEVGVQVTVTADIGNNAKNEPEVEILSSDLKKHEKNESDEEDLDDTNEKSESNSSEYDDDDDDNEDDDFELEYKESNSESHEKERAKSGEKTGPKPKEFKIKTNEMSSSEEALYSHVKNIKEKHKDFRAITVYEHENHKGRALVMGIKHNECIEMPSDFDNEITSVNTHDSCVIFYKDGGCIGDCTKVAPGTYNHLNIGVKFNDQISSLRLCNKGK